MSCGAGSFYIGLGIGQLDQLTDKGNSHTLPRFVFMIEGLMQKVNYQKNNKN